MRTQRGGVPQELYPKVVERGALTMLNIILENADFRPAIFVNPANDVLSNEGYAAASILQIVGQDYQAACDRLVHNHRGRLPPWDVYPTKGAVGMPWVINAVLMPNPREDGPQDRQRAQLQDFYQRSFTEARAKIRGLETIVMTLFGCGSYGYSTDASGPLDSL